MVYFPCKRLIAHILLLGQLLTSCGTPRYLRRARLGLCRASSSVSTSSSAICRVGHTAPRPIPLLQGVSSTTPSSASSAFSYTFFKDPGYKIVLEPDGARWKAMVHDNRFPGLSRSYAAAVRFKKGYRLEDFVTKSPSYQSHHIHLLSMNKDRPMVYIGSMGLHGGGCHDQATWFCVFCGDRCPNQCCESCCSHKNDSKHQHCKLQAQQQLYQERQTRNKFRCQKEELESLTSEHKMLKEDLMQEESSLQAYSHKKRAERTARSLALVEALAAKKQSIYHQSFLDGTQVLYNKFIANLEPAIPLKESIAQATITTTTIESAENSYAHLAVPSDQPAESASPFSDDGPTIDPALPLSASSSPPVSVSHYKQLPSATGQTGYDMVCSAQPDQLIHLKNYWLSEQVNSLPHFSASPEACSQLTDALSRTDLSPSFIHSLLSAIREEDDLPSLLNFLDLISKRKVPELIVSSIIYEKDAPLALSKSKAYQWLTALCCELSLMHLSKIEANASDSIAPILYNCIKQEPTIAPSLEAFIYSRSHSIVKQPATFIALLALIDNYQIKEEITAAVFDALLEEMPSEWITKADQCITGKLFQAGAPYRVEALIAEMVASAPSMLYKAPSPDHTFASSHYLKTITIEKVLTHQVVENLKPAIKAQLVSLINGYEQELAILETSACALRDEIKQAATKRLDLSRCFNIENQSYKNASTALEAEEKSLSIEIDKLVKENGENLKKSAAAVKKLEAQLGAQAAAATPTSLPTDQPKAPSKLAKLQDKLHALLKTRSNVTTSYQVKKESYEAASAALLNQIKVLEVDLFKLEENQKPIRLKIKHLSQEDATNFSDYSLYKEVLASFCKSTPILRTSDHKPLDPYSPLALTRWSQEIKRATLFGAHTISEIIFGINQAITLSNNSGLTKSQHLDLLSRLFPFCKQAIIQRSKDPLVVICLAAICALQNGQVSLVTDSKEWPISESAILSYLPLFKILDLTATKRDSTAPLSSCKSNIVYGKHSDFSPIPRIMDCNLLQQKQQRIDHCYHSTLLRLAASAPVTLHELEAYYNRIGSIQKDKKQLRTLQDAANQDVDLSPPPSTAYEQLKQQYDAIEACYQSSSRMLQDSSLNFKEKPIAQWNQEEIKDWATYAQAHYQPGLEIELIAAVQHAVKLHYPFSPRPTQLLALLALLHPTYDKGRLAQINTGEGKSLIVAMLAAIHGLQGKQVDVITTSTELSIPEVKEKSGFFKLLNLSVSENSPSSNKVAVYKHQIVYGTASDFQADILRQEFLGENTRGDRGYDIVLVDEVDSLLFDNRSHSVRLGSNHPGMDHLKLPLGTIWHYIQWMVDHMFEYKGQVYFTAKDSISPASDLTTDTSVIPIQEDKRSFITRMTTVYLEQLLRKLDPTEAQEYKAHFKKRSEIAQLEQKIKSIQDKGGTAQAAIQHRDQLAEALQNLPWSQRAPILDMPDHLRQFARIQLPSWIQHCLSARFDYQKKRHYIVSKENKIVPVQYNETGVLQPNLVWSDGLCQFLQIKEGLSVDPESISTNAFSNIGFFKRYGNALYGLTGTLGQAATRAFLEALYGVDFVVIPPYQRTKIQDNGHTSYLCKELKPIVVAEQDWSPAILYHLLHHAKQGRAALAICQSIKHAEYLEAQLKAHYDPNKVFTYTGVTTLQEDKVNSGDIILATNIAGRGTDLKTAQEVEDKGGMYVALTFLPETNRVELQNVGRTARSGKKGMAQLILSNPDVSSVEALKAARQAKEIKTTQNALEEAKKTLAQDALLEHFCSVTNTYLPSAADCASIDQAATILPKWEQILKTKFTDHIIDEQFQKWIVQSKQAWHNLFSGGEIPYSQQLDKDLSSRKEAFRSAYRNKLLEDFQSAHPMLSNSLLSALQNDEPFTPHRSVLAEKYDWGSFERKAVEERWGIWLKAQHAGAADHAAQDRLALFQRFDDEFSVQLAQDAHRDQLIKNPYFYTLKGNKLLAHGSAKDAAICYDRAIQLDPIFSLHSRYNKARALLSCKENKGSSQKEAYKELATAKELIDALYRPNLMAFHGLVGHGKANTHTVMAIQHDLDIVSQQEKYIQQAFEVLRDAGATRNKKLANVSLTNQSLGATFKDPHSAMAHGQSIREAGLKGLADLFTIKKIPPYPLFGIISMALISLSQIAVGCLLTAYGGIQVGMSLIKNGISDIVTTIKSAFQGSFDWGAWALQKGIALMIAVASYGVNVAKEAINGATTTAESVKESMLSTKQAIKDIIGGKSLVETGMAKELTIETVTREVVEKAPQQVIKETITTQLKQRAIGELIDKTSQCLADEVWAKQQAKKIRRVVRQELTQAFTNNALITHALKLDRDQNNSAWQQCFLGEAQGILNNMLKSDPAGQVLKQIGKGTLYHTVYSQDLKVGAKEVEVGAGVLNAIRKSCSDKSDTIAPLTKKFIAAFTQRIATYKHQIEQAKESNQSIQTPISSSHQTITMAPPIDNEGEIIIAQVNDLTDFSPPDRSANPIRENFSNLGPSTPENLVGALEEYLCGDAIQNLNEEIMSGVSYGANYINEQLFKKVNAENQQFLNALEARGVNRYIDLKKDKQQETIEQAELIENNQQDKPLEENSPTEKSIGQAKSKKQVILDPHTQKAIKALQEGDVLTRAHIRMIAHLLPSPIRFFDESGQPLGEDIGGYKSGKPICLALIRGTNGGKDHIKPLNLTPTQRAQYESLDQATNNCALNALFVHLPKEKQQQIKSPEGLRQAAADYMQEHPALCRDLFKYQEKLSQLAPTEVPRMGFPVVPLVQAGLAAWTAWQVYRTGKNIVNDTKVQKSWEERNYIDIFKHAVPHLPVFGDAMRGGRALALGDAKGAWLYPSNALFTIYGGKVIGKGSALLLKKIAPEINKLRCGRWLAKPGGTGVKGGNSIGNTTPTSLVPCKIAKAAQKIANGEYSITKTVAQKLDSRPYINSPSTIKNIITSNKGIPDKTFQGGMNWKVSGEFNGRKGIYELGMNPETGVIYHFLFKRVK